VRDAARKRIYLRGLVVTSVGAAVLRGVGSVRAGCE
jgi:hypothetical protein